MIKYETPCCRCGFCCISESCPLAIEFYGISKKTMCPSLYFDGDNAICNMFVGLLSNGIPKDDAEFAFGIGAGCCIKARAFKGDEIFNFSSLEETVKKAIVRILREALI